MIAIANSHSRPIGLNYENQAKLFTGGKLQACSAADGTGAVDITGAVFTQVTTSNDAPNVQKIWIEAGSMPAATPYLRYIGTIVTGPSVVGVTLHARKKYIG